MAFAALRDLGYPEDLLALSRTGLSRIREVLAPFLALLAGEAGSARARVVADPLPVEVWIVGVPAWAYDTHTRAGIRALQHFLAGNSETARWARELMPPGQRRTLAGNLLFFVEGGLLKRRWRWPLGGRLRRMAERECLGLAPEEAARGLALLRRDLPLLHEARRHVAGPNLR
jgi:hypothetical protein